MSARTLVASVVMILVTSTTILGSSLTASGATPRQMSPQQVANFALTCAARNSGSKVTNYHDIKCAAEHSTNITVVTGIVGGPTEFPAYSTVGFFLNSVTRQYTCFAYPDRAGARPVNITPDCPLWIISKEYAKTNYPLAFALASAFPPDSPAPTLSQIQSVASSSRGLPTVTSGSGKVFIEGITPESTFQMSYRSGIGRDWCVWFYSRTNSAGESETASLVSPPGMYGTC